jgi:hypothetical protein
MIFQVACPHDETDLCVRCAEAKTCDECGLSPAWPAPEWDASCGPQVRYLCAFHGEWEADLSAVGRDLLASDVGAS